jgi:hypothetical protein
MVNPFKEVDWHPNVSARRRFAMSLMVGFPCVALGFWMILGVKTGGWDTAMPVKIGFYGASAGIVFYLVPIVAKPFYLVWYAIACCIGLVVGNLLLALVFYVFVTGIGVVMRLIGRDPMNRRLDRSAASYWRDVHQPADSRRYYSQF